MLIRMFGRIAGVTAIIASAMSAAHAIEPFEIRSAESEPVFTQAAVSSSSEDGVASVRMAGFYQNAGGPACGPGGNCGPMAGPACGPNGCRDYMVSPYASYGPCPGGCPTAYRHAQPGADCYAGRPYTLGDLGSDLGWCKSHCDEVNPLSCKNLNCAYQGSALQQWWCDEKMKYQCNRAYRNQVWGAHLHNKFNYFCPSGNGGKGTPLFGHYSRVIAQEPGYYDIRDKQVYGSAMNGVPTAVPLAPNVRHQYNYGWGTPSSRLTPISTIVPPQ